MTLVTKAKPTAKRPRPKLVRQQVVDEIVRLLKKYYPNAHCALDHKNPFELLVATILSAQCTDDRVNTVTPALFKKYPTAQKMANAKIEDLEELVRSTGFFKNKASNIKSCSKSLVEKYGGELPRTLDQMVELAGVGRKTGNVVLGNAFGIPSGVVVDTHVSRLSNRFAWVKTENAVQIERVLMKLVSEADWILLPHLLISHGRAICKARKPQCDKCFLETICPKRLE